MALAPLDCLANPHLCPSLLSRMRLMLLALATWVTDVVEGLSWMDCRWLLAAGETGLTATAFFQSDLDVSVAYCDLRQGLIAVLQE